MSDAIAEPAAHSTAEADTSEHPVVTSASKPRDAALVESDLLVEDVSIDGMCGVY